MGGMGFIENNKALCMLSVLINTHLLMAAKDAGIERYFYSSSACVYAADKQTDPNVTALKEEDAYPAMPEDGYGWEKLFSERMCRHFREDFGIATRMARYHNVYGPHGTEVAHHHIQSNAAGSKALNKARWSTGLLAVNSTKWLISANATSRSSFGPPPIQRSLWRSAELSGFLIFDR